MLLDDTLRNDWWIFGGKKEPWIGLSLSARFKIVQKGDWGEPTG